MIDLNQRQQIKLAGQTTMCHLRELSPVDQVSQAPATHSGACIFIPGVEANMTFVYGGYNYRVVAAWDEAERKLSSPAVLTNLPPGSRSAGRNKLTQVEATYYLSRKGKFLDLLVTREDPVDA